MVVQCATSSTGISAIELRRIGNAVGGGKGCRRNSRRRSIRTVVEFLIAYGFQILGALIVLYIGIKLAGWTGRRTQNLALAKSVDLTLSKFLGDAVKVFIVVLVIVITLANLDVSIAPLVAVAGASAFGVTMAIQGPLSNYGAGLAIILGRPFVVGNTITVRRVSGVVDNISLAATKLIGEDGEHITVPNKQIVGEVLVNSLERRVVETKVCIGADQDHAKAIEVIIKALEHFPDLASDARPQVGIHDFTYGGIIIGVRFWVRSMRYFEIRYRVNQTILRALDQAGIALMQVGATAIAVHPLAGEDTRLDDGAFGGVSC